MQGGMREAVRSARQAVLAYNKLLYVHLHVATCDLWSQVRGRCVQVCVLCNDGVASFTGHTLEPRRACYKVSYGGCRRRCAFRNTCIPTQWSCQHVCAKSTCRGGFGCAARHGPVSMEASRSTRAVCNASSILLLPSKPGGACATSGAPA